VPHSHMRYGLERHKTTRAIPLRATRPLEASLSAPGPNSFCPCAPQGCYAEEAPRRVRELRQSRSLREASPHRSRRAGRGDEVPKEQHGPRFRLGFWSCLGFGLALGFDFDLDLAWLAPRAAGAGRVKDPPGRSESDLCSTTVPPDLSPPRRPTPAAKENMAGGRQPAAGALTLRF